MYILSHLKNEMPMFFGKGDRMAELIKGLDVEFRKIQQQYRLPPGDFPNIERYVCLLFSVIFFQLTYRLLVCLFFSFFNKKSFRMMLKVQLFHIFYFLRSYLTLGSTELRLRYVPKTKS